jgi:two-component system sensor histidine kinase RegB
MSERASLLGPVRAAPLVPSNLAWLVRLRWGAVLSQILTILVARVGLGLALGLLPLTVCVALAVLSNVLCSLWQRRGTEVSEAAIARVMALDQLLLTALLYFSGGPMNPFSVLYLVHVALSAAILKAGHAWALALLSTALYGTLFLLPMRHDAVMHAMGMHHPGSAGLGLHFQGMWVAFTIAALFIVYFVTRIARSLEHARALAEAARARVARSEKLASLATLAAGAAHELGTPLSTIAVVAKELERGLAQGTLHGDATADARTIRDEVERCRVILAQMAQDAGETLGEALDALSLSELVEAALEGVRERERVAVEVSDPDLTIRVPQRAMAQATRALVKNALEASHGKVRLAASAEGEWVTLDVIDQGAGMSDAVLERVGEPFFTTKSQGRGMGLGVFLARAVLERLEGQLRYESQAGRGTRARATFPRALRHAGERTRGESV